MKWLAILVRWLALALVLAGNGKLRPTTLQAAEGSSGSGLVRRSKPPTTELNWVRDQLLLHDEDLQKLLSHLNEEKEFGPAVPKGHLVTPSVKRQQAAFTAQVSRLSGTATAWLLRNRPNLADWIFVDPPLPGL